MASDLKHWSVDFVEHLRTVHFALLAVAVSLAVLASAPRDDSEARAALPLISQILALRTNWPKDWVETFRPKDRADRLPASETWTFYVGLDGHPDTLAPDGKRYWSSGMPWVNFPPDKEHPIGHGVLETDGLEKLSLALMAPAHQWSANRKITYEGPGFRQTVYPPASPSSLYADAPPATLEEFQDWWDKSQSLQVAFFTSWRPGGDNKISREDDQGNLTDSKSVFACLPNKTDEGALKRVACIPNTPDQNTQRVNLTMQSFRYTGEIEMPDGDRGVITLGAAGGSTDVQVRPWQVAEFAGERCRPNGNRAPSHDCRLFGKAFPELVGVEAELGRLPLEKLMDELVRRASFEPEPIELGGIKFPIKAMTQLGIVFLLLIQFYLWLHVHEMKGSVDWTHSPGFDVAWIGVYTSRIARLIYAITLLFPSFAIFLLESYIPTSLRTRAVLGVTGGVLSVALAVATFRETPRNTQNQPPQDPEVSDPSS